jgi:hypothetical protein
MRGGESSVAIEGRREGGRRRARRKNCEGRQGGGGRARARGQDAINDVAVNMGGTGGRHDGKEQSRGQVWEEGAGGKGGRGVGQQEFGHEV